MAFQLSSVSIIQNSVFIGNLHFYFWMKRKTVEACDWLRVDVFQQSEGDPTKISVVSNDVLHRLVDVVVEYIVNTLTSSGVLGIDLFS